MEFFRKHHTAFHVFTFAVTAMVAIVILIPQLFASNPYPAFDEIGHNPLNFDNQDTNNSAGVNEAGFNTPIGIAIDTDNHWMFVADADNDRVMVFDLDSSNHLIDRLADHVLGQLNLSSSSGTGTTDGNMNYPDVIEYDQGHHRLFVSDGLHDRVMVFDFSGGSITDGVDANYILGTGASSPPTANSINSPNGLTYDETNDILYVADTLSDRVLAFDARPIGSAPRTLCGVSTTGIVTGMDASCVLGEPDFESVNHDGSGYEISPAAAYLYYPTGLFLDDAHSLLYVASDQISVRVFDVSTISNGEPAIHYLGADFNTFSYDPNTDTTYDPGTQPYSLGNPRGMTFDSENNILYISDTNNERMLGFDVSTITDGENAVSVIGAPDLITNTGGNVGQTYLFAPQWSVWDPVTRIHYVVDAVNNRVMLFKIISIDSTTLSNATVGIPYTGTIPVNDEQGSVSFEVLSGAIPAGMSFNSTGLTGTPTVAGSYSFTVRAVDTVGAAGNFYSNHQSYSITVAAASGGGGGGGPIWCQDPLATNFGGSPPCLYPPPPDQCPNIPDVQGTIPAGMMLDTNNDCVPIPTPVDLCPNISDVQVTIPANMALDANGNCTLVTQIPDICPNISGLQPVLPAGMYVDVVGNCLLIDQYTDMCPNLPNEQYTIPAGYVLDTNGNCVGTNAPDVCPNLSGIQGSLPPGMILNSSGQCVMPIVPDFCPNIVGDQNTIPSGMTVDANGQCIDIPPPTDVCINISGIQSALPSGMQLSGGLCVPISQTDLCSNITGAQSTIPTGMELSNGECVPISQPTCATDPSLCPVQNDTPPIYGSGCTLDAPPGSPLGTIIWTQISGSFCQTVVTLSTAFSSAAEVYRSPYGDVLSKTISAVGLVIGAFVALSTTLFASPLTFSEVALIPQRLWSLLMIAFGLKKRIRPWGTVYDAVTKQPLDPAYVVLYDKEGKEVATSITDLDGRYGFLVGPGIYRMIANKTNYSFPSLVLSRHTRDEIYLDLYFGNYFEVKEESKLIARNIPLDPDKFDWNEFAKKQQKLMKFYSKRDRIITRISDIFFAVGFVLALIALLVSPIGYNIAIFVLYVLLLVIKEIGIKPKQLGGVLEKDTLAPISFGLVHIFSKSLNTELMARVLDKKGHYYALVPNATYYITIDRKNPDQTYTKIFTSEPFEVTDGVINRKFLV